MRLLLTAASGRLVQCGAKRGSSDRALRRRARLCPRGSRASRRRAGRPGPGGDHARAKPGHLPRRRRDAVPDKRPSPRSRGTSMHDHSPSQSLRPPHAEAHRRQVTPRHRGPERSGPRQPASSSPLPRSRSAGPLRFGRPVWVPDVARSSMLADTPALEVLLDAGVLEVASVRSNPTGNLAAGPSLHHRVPTEWTADENARSRAPRAIRHQQYTNALRLASPITGAATP